MQTNSNRKLKIVLTGGGTGGHIYPAIAVGRELLTNENIEKIYYVGNPQNLEKTITEKENFEFLPRSASSCIYFRMDQVYLSVECGRLAEEDEFMTRHKLFGHPSDAFEKDCFKLSAAIAYPCTKPFSVNDFGP